MNNLHRELAPVSAAALRLVGVDGPYSPLLTAEASVPLTWGTGGAGS